MARPVVLLSLLLLAACAAAPERLADAASMAEARQAALEVNRNGQAMHWRQAATGNRGTVTPLATWQDSRGRDCRSFRETGDGHAVTVATACRRDDGVWVEQPPLRVVAVAPAVWAGPRFHIGFGTYHHFGHGLHGGTYYHFGHFAAPWWWWHRPRWPYGYYWY